LSVKTKGTKDNPWVLKTPSGTSEFKSYRDEAVIPPAVVVWVGKIELRYHLRDLDDLTLWADGTALKRVYEGALQTIFRQS
jgi:hypothetical protein